MKWEKALKYTRKHKRMIAVMMAGVIGFACFYSADASVIKDAKKKKNEAQQNLDNINQQINNIQSEQSKVKSQMADRKSTRLNSSHIEESRMPSSA